MKENEEAKPDARCCTASVNTGEAKAARERDPRRKTLCRTVPHSGAHEMGNEREAGVKDVLAQHGRV